MTVVTPVQLQPNRKRSYEISRMVFEIDAKCVPIKGETNEVVAIKKITNVFGDQVGALRTPRELLLLRCIKHENVIAPRDVMITANPSGFQDVYMVYKLMDTDLHHIITSPLPLTNDHCKYFIFQLLRGFKFLHSANILHRDPKPGNLLVNANCELKICDVGLARTNSKNEQFMTEYVVTRWYRAPELLLSCDNYGPSIDMWSVGCILAEILGRKPIFPGKDCLDQLKLIICILGIQSEVDLEFVDSEKTKRFIQSLGFSSGTRFSCLYPHADPLGIDLLERLLVFEPSKRITAADALCHPFVSSLYDPLSNPPAQYEINFDTDEGIGEPVIREMMWREMFHYHPEAACVDLF